MRNTSTAYKILKALMSKQTNTPLRLAQEIDRAPQSVRDSLVHLNRTSLVVRVDHGLYRITELGQEVFNKLSQPSQDQSSRESQ